MALERSGSGGDHIASKHGRYLLGPQEISKNARFSRYFASFLVGRTLMATRPRYIEPHSLVEVSCRTVGSRFLLKPSKTANDLVAGVLARAARLYPVDVAAFVSLSSSRPGRARKRRTTRAIHALAELEYRPGDRTPQRLAPEVLDSALFRHTHLQRTRSPDRPSEVHPRQLSQRAAGRAGLPVAGPSQRPSDPRR